MKLLFAMLLSLPVCASTAELILAGGRKIAYTDIILSADSPMNFITLKNMHVVTSLKYSEIDMGGLPTEMQAEAKAYIHERLQRRMIIHEDKWVHRDEVLLNRDERYAAKGKLPKIGQSILNFTNETDRLVTIAVRSGGKGYEMHIEAKKTKGYQVPNGTITYLMAQESDDGTRLIVQKGKELEAKNMNWKVTIVRSEDIPKEEIGFIEIPRELQVHDAGPPKE